jgi:hypothetical protein
MVESSNMILTNEQLHNFISGYKLMLINGNKNNTVYNRIIILK